MSLPSGRKHVLKRLILFGKTASINKSRIQSINCIKNILGTSTLSPLMKHYRPAIWAISECFDVKFVIATHPLALIAFLSLHPRKVGVYSKCTGFETQTTFQYMFLRRLLAVFVLFEVVNANGTNRYVSNSAPPVYLHGLCNIPQMNWGRLYG